jgi:PhnB protein
VKHRHTSTYLNFNGNTEEAFEFYRSVFGGEFIGGISRMGEVPGPEGAPPMSEAQRNLVMHVALPIFGGHYLMGTDATEEMGFQFKFGNNSFINLHAGRNGSALLRTFRRWGSQLAPAEHVLGDYFGSCTDKFGV